MRILSALLTVLLASQPASALSSNRGGAAMEFLRIGAGARALGMGDAFAPIAEGADSVYWNPAGMVQSRHLEISATHIDMLEFFSHDNFAVIKPFPKSRNAIGFSATFFSQDSLNRVSNTNQQLGSFRPHSESFSFAVAHAFGKGDTLADSGGLYDFKDRSIYEINRRGDRSRHFRAGNVMVGAAVKHVRETLNTRTATALAIDFGVLARPESIPELSISGTIRNFGSRPKFINELQDLPTEFSAGAAYNISSQRRRFLTAVEAIVPIYGTPYGKLGFEYSLAISGSSFISFRGGYKSLSAPTLGIASGVTGGIGFGFGRFTFDFGFQPMGDLGEAYRGSAGFRF
ncbi:MAG: hypothetical protein COB53_00640 [Elusimicrobia bacterium]|nr:MAG: hypothetical protein COB53_00640 [Elusimicrobiota bacterium]